MVQRVRRGDLGSLSDTEVSQRRMESELKKREEKIRRDEEEKQEMRRREEEEKKNKEAEKRQEQEARIRDLDTISEAGTVFSNRIHNITKLCDIIHQSVCKETGGKISVTRADQQTVKGSIMELQKEVIGVILKQVELLEENVKLRDSIPKGTPTRAVATRELKGMEDGRMNAEKERMERERERIERERRSERKGKRISRAVREVEEEQYDSTSSFEEVRPKRKTRTYAEASKGANVSSAEVNERREKVGNERIQGRVVVPGSSGWKTPPPVTKEGESTLIISSQTLKDPNRLIQTLVKSIPAKEIGGAPAVVRPARDGRVIIVPRDKEQQERLKQQIGTIRNVEVREARKAEPLVVISGVDKGVSEREFVEQLVRGMGEGMKGTVNDVKIVRRMECRNPWKENILVRMDLEDFKNVVEGSSELTQIATGHGDFKAYLGRFRLNDGESERCECGGAIEDVRHVVMDCLLETRVRARTALRAFLGHYPPRLDRMKEEEWMGVLNWARVLVKKDE